MNSAVPVGKQPAVGDVIVQQLTIIWEGLLATHPIDRDQNYFDLGGDSLTAVQMFAQIEKVFQAKLPVATLFDAPTIAELAEILKQETAKSRWPSLVAIQTKGTRPPFFCVHPHGGNVLVYRDLSRHLGIDQPFFGLQSQGLDGTCEPLKRIEDMAAQYVWEIQRVQPRGPYFLGGYCLGGVVAYEMALQLLASGQEIGLLALIDTLNASGSRPLNPWERVGHTTERLLFHATNLFSLDAPNRKRFLLEKFRTIRTKLPVWWTGFLHKDPGGGVLGENNSEAQVLAQIWRANEQSCIDYVPHPYPGLVTDVRPVRQYRCFDKPEFRWDRLSQGGVRTIVLPVNPPAIMVEPYVVHLAHALRQSIDDAARDSKCKHSYLPLDQTKSTTAASSRG